MPDVIGTSSSVSSFKRNIAQIDLSEYLFYSFKVQYHFYLIVFSLSLNSQGDLLVLTFDSPGQPILEFF